MIHFVMTDFDRVRVLDLASWRQEEAIKHDRPNTYGCEMPGLEAHLLGAAAEYAAHVWSGLPWNAKLDKLNAGGRKDADLGVDVQVRGTYHRTGKLIVHEQDYSSHRFILGIVEENIEWVNLRGWRAGQFVKQEQFWGDPKGNRPAFWLPQRFLHPMDTFIKRSPVC